MFRLYVLIVLGFVTVFTLRDVLNTEVNCLGGKRSRSLSMPILTYMYK